MTRGTTKTLRVGGIFLVVIFLLCAFISLPQPVQATNTVTATVTVGSEPENVAVTPNGAYAYVANYLNDSVSVISTGTNTVTATVAVGSHPGDVAITPNGAYVYVTNFIGSSVSVINTATNTATTTITVGTYPEGVAITPNGAYAYIANGGNGSVSVINTAKYSNSDDNRWSLSFRCGYNA